MRTFQLVHNGRRVARLIVNCHADPMNIAEACFGACLSFSMAAKYGELENKAYCGMEEFERTLKTGAHVRVYHVEEGGEDD